MSATSKRMDNRLFDLLGNCAICGRAFKPRGTSRAEHGRKHVGERKAIEYTRADGITVIEKL